MAQALPDVVDVGAQALHSLLADGMIEDLRTVKRINKLVVEAQGNVLRSPQGKTYEKVELIEASSCPGELASLPKCVLSQPGKTLHDARLRLLYRLLRNLLAGFGTGTGNDELLSYIFFERHYAARQIELGRTEGKRAADEGWHLTDSARSCPAPRAWHAELEASS